MERFKLEIYIPESHFAELQKTLQAADAGHLGKYDSCLSYSRVKGTWRPLAGAHPHIGVEGAICEVDEIKVEVIVNKSNLNSTLRGIKTVHPYEEPLINVIPLYTI